MEPYKDYGYSESSAMHGYEYIFNRLLHMLDKKENNNVLDLGCGNGAMVNALVNKGFNAFGTDASLSGIEQAKLTNPDRFAVQDINSDQIPPSLSQVQFDTILATELIEHLYAPRNFILSCKEILQKNGGGTLILSTPYHGYLKNIMLSLFNKWDKHLDPLWDGGHIKLWSYRSLSTLLEEAGFKITDFKGCGRIPYLWKSMLIKAKI